MVSSKNGIVLVKVEAVRLKIQKYLINWEIWSQNYEGEIKGEKANFRREPKSSERNSEIEANSNDYF